MGPLEDLYLTSRAGVTVSNTGMDSPGHCRDIAHYSAYPHDISYQYNSRGFRDEEWPRDLEQAVWCVGDSYTVGIGQAFAEIWCRQLMLAMHCRTINISMDGASNAWISRRAAQILREVQPRTLILHWSFLHRREDSRTDLSDELRRIWHERQSDDLAEFERCVESVEAANLGSQVIHSTIPNFSPNPVIRQVFLRRRVGRRALPDLAQLDHGRDGYHYGAHTVRRLVDNIMATLLHQD